MKKWHLVSALAIGLIVTLGATNVTNSHPQMANSSTDGGFKNLKVLPKDISKEALDSVMGEFCTSLGVHCNFCHARKADTTQRGLDFPSDAKDEKNTAREMFKMTANLNSTFFNWKHSAKPDTIHYVICYTCHRGSHEPDSKVFLAQIDSIQALHKKNHPK